MSNLRDFYDIPHGDRVQTLAAPHGNTVLDVSKYEVFVLTLTQAVSITFTGFPTDEHKTVMVVVNNAGTHITWPGQVKWPDGKAPSLSVTGRDRLLFASEDAGHTVDGGICGLGYA